MSARVAKQLVLKVFSKFRFLLWPGPGASEQERLGYQGSISLTEVSGFLPEFSLNFLVREWEAFRPFLVHVSILNLFYWLFAFKGMEEQDEVRG